MVNSVYERSSVNLTCCNEINRMRDNSEMKNRMCTDLELDLYNQMTASTSDGLMRKSIQAMDSDCILKHIRTCCGFGQFLDELFCDYPMEQLSDIPRYRRFLLLLAVMMDEKLHGTVLYDRLFNCIPFIRRSLDGGLYAMQSCSGSMKHIFPSDSTVSPQRLVDFIICLNESDCFKTLMDLRILDLNIPIYDFKRAVDFGAELPKGIIDVCDEIDYLSKYNDKILDFMGRRTNPYIEGFSALVEIETTNFYSDEYKPDEYKPYNIIPALICYERGMKYKEGDKFARFFDLFDLRSVENLLKELDSRFGTYEELCNRMTGTVDTDELKLLFDIFSMWNIPIFTGRHKIFLEKPRYGKSATN